MNSTPKGRGHDRPERTVGGAETRAAGTLAGRAATTRPGPAAHPPREPRRPLAPLLCPGAALVPRPAGAGQPGLHYPDPAANDRAAGRAGPGTQFECDRAAAREPADDVCGWRRRAPGDHRRGVDPGPAPGRPAGGAAPDGGGPTADRRRERPALRPGARAANPRPAVAPVRR